MGQSNYTAETEFYCKMTKLQTSKLEGYCEKPKGFSIKMAAKGRNL